jgi:outer membrane protein TolC
VTTADDSTTDLFDDWIRTLAGNLLAPVFRGGALAAEVDRADAVRAARTAEYRQVSLEALREVEDALILESKRAERVASLERQLRLSVTTTRQLGTEYLNGSGDFIDLLVAQTAEQRLRRDLLAARRLLLEDRVALYRAVAGAIETDGTTDSADEAVSGAEETADADRRPMG